VKSNLPGMRYTKDEGNINKVGIKKIIISKYGIIFETNCTRPRGTGRQAVTNDFQKP
jgi:hypothetical protein